MLKITNISVGQLVCTLADGSTLRLTQHESSTIKDEQTTPYLENIEKKGYIKIAKVQNKK